jgi:hypothetical protein
MYIFKFADLYHNLLKKYYFLQKLQIIITRHLLLLILAPAQ